MLKNEVIKDVFNRSVFVGQQVGVLIKCRCYVGIYNAKLMRATYLGKGQWGYEFNAGSHTIVRIKKPEVVKK